MLEAVEPDRQRVQLRVRYVGVLRVPAQQVRVAQQCLAFRGAEIGLTAD
eukprot:CAMPEP_0182593618 /NCGR_PEP_ID=MMETSP1324-20130603/78451_1 /TAXON_ID=236786 /ORGANISM="Florenciella sp., Strain RCC1587" /LENGTH=48 /DNA_ID= /DNA_START= /DNA_END= /DNA_ORIENTATION=